MDIELLNKTIAELNKSFKMEKLTSGANKIQERLPTGSYSIDDALGGGWPMGRFGIVWGNYSSGKTSLCFLTIANAQKLGKKCIYIDAEKTFESDWAAKHGVDLDDLILVQTTTVEDILEILEPLVKNELVDVVVIDSINAINYEKFYEDNNGSIGLHSKAMGDLMNKLNSFNKNTLILFISQLRMKMTSFYTSASHSGGNAAHHFPSVSIQLMRSEGKDKKMTGDIIWHISKSKVSMPFLTGQYTLLKTGGIDTVSEIVDLGVQYGLVKKAGSWVYYGDKKVHGEESFLQFLHEDNSVLEELTHAVLEKIDGREGPQKPYSDTEDIVSDNPV